MDYAGRVGGEELKGWINEKVKFPNCMVDRITPRTKEVNRGIFSSSFIVFLLFLLFLFVTDNKISGGYPLYRKQLLDC